MSSVVDDGRIVVELYLRSFPGWENLRRAVAAAAKVQLDEVRAVREIASPAVELDAVARPIGFQATATLKLDPARVASCDALALAREVARATATDVATAELGAETPRRWLLVRPDGRTFVVEAQPRTDRVLLLDERPERLRPLERVS